MKSTIVERPPLLLVGFDFFGDPFRSHGGWSEENEIGRVWARWMAYLEKSPTLYSKASEMGVMYEVHVTHPETPQAGEWEIFVGMEIEDVGELPPEVVVKLLPAHRYAVFTLSGEEIVSDWYWLLDHEWLPALGERRRTDFSFQRYDARFKGLEPEQIEDSELDVYIPLAPREP